ncbi:MAG TPA: chemotaxis protein CheB [Longimicrobium sp.]|jgi:two-component system chemotaxis response regulator CheB
MSTPHAPAQSPPLAAIGGSAGSFPVLQELLGLLPASFPGALLVVMHVERDRHSLLPDLLARATELTVLPARGGERPRAGHVYVAPPDRHLVVRPGPRLSLSSAEPECFSRPAVDPLFASLAEVCGAGAVAVVLSGMGHDGSRGAAEVHRRGGTVVAQSAATASHGSMPAAAIATGGVAHVLAPAEVAELLMKLLTPAPR